MIEREYWPAIGLAAALAAAFWAGRRDFSKPNLAMFWDDMAVSPAYASQSVNPVFPNGQTEQTPPPGTIARGAKPFAFAPTDADRERAGRELKNPFPPTPANLERGRYVFLNFCTECHGRQGLGDGPVASLYPELAFPAASAPIYQMPDGELFHIITYGNNNMPSAASQLSPQDRWKVIDYLRVLQRRQMASP